MSLIGFLSRPRASDMRVARLVLVPADTHTRADGLGREVHDRFAPRCAAPTYAGETLVLAPGKHGWMDLTTSQCFAPVATHSCAYYLTYSGCK
jgi:hypothetical protein